MHLNRLNVVVQVQETSQGNWSQDGLSMLYSINCSLVGHRWQLKCVASNSKASPTNWSCYVNSNYIFIHFFRNLFVVWSINTQKFALHSLVVGLACHRLPLTNEKSSLPQNYKISHLVVGQPTSRE